MALKDQITEDMKTAMRAKDSVRLGTIRLLQAAMKQKEVDERIELFYAELSAEATGQKLDADERVATVALTAEEIETHIASGALRDAKSIAAWFLHLRLTRAGASS
jgi:hypothetical protein